MLSNTELDGPVFWVSCALLAKLVLLGSGGTLNTGTSGPLKTLCVGAGAGAGAGAGVAMR